MHHPMTNWFIAAAGVVALGSLSIPAQAAPVGGLIGDPSAAGHKNIGVEQVRDWRWSRHRHNRHYGYRSYRSDSHVYAGKNNRGRRMRNPN
jgi:hypothetical protein